MKIIFFPTGAFGSTIEYCIRRFSKEFETIDTDIQSDGSMHGYLKELHILQNNDFSKINRYNGIATPVYPNESAKPMGTTIEEFKNYLLPNQKVLFITLDSEPQIERNSLFQSFKVSFDLSKKFYKLNDIKKWNESYNSIDDMERWELREFLSISFEDLVSSLMTARNYSEKNWMLINPDDLLNNFSHTIKNILNYFDLTFIDDGLEEFAKVWISKQQYIIDRYELVNQIVYHILENKDLTWPNLDLQSEVLIQYKLRKNGKILKPYGLNCFPQSTKEILTFIDEA